MASSEPSTGPGTWAYWLKNALAAAEMTAAQLSRQVSNEPSISQWLAGTRHPRDGEIVIAVADALGQPNAIAALEAAGMTNLAAEIRKKIRHVYEDQALVRIRTMSGVSAADRGAIEANFLRRRADAVRIMEMELAEALKRAGAEGEDGDAACGPEFQDAAEA